MRFQRTKYRETPKKILLDVPKNKRGEGPILIEAKKGYDRVRRKYGVPIVREFVIKKRRENTRGYKS